MRSSSMIRFRSTPFLLYINDMPPAVDCELLLYADDSCLIFKHQDITEIETALN